jgi:hypothetical protein
MKLKVLESYTRDVGRGIARVDYDTMDKLNISTGDPIRLSRKGKISVRSALPLYPSDEDKGIIRIDGLSRANIVTAIGESIELEKVSPQNAKTVVCTPLEEIPPIDERYLADALGGVYLSNTDCFMVPYFGGRLTFQVVEVMPNESKVTPQTEFTIVKKIPQRLDDNEILQSDIEDAKEFRSLCRIFQNRASLVKFSDDLKAMENESNLLKTANAVLTKELDELKATLNKGSKKDPNVIELNKLRAKLKNIKSVVNN